MNKLIKIIIILCVAVVSCVSCSSKDSLTISSVPVTQALNIRLSGHVLDVVAEEGGTIPVELNVENDSFLNWVELAAYPDPGFSFYRWYIYTGDSDVISYTISQNPTRVSVQTDMKAVAVFRKSGEIFLLTFDSGPGGGYAAGGGSFASGAYYEGDKIPVPSLRPLPGYAYDKIVAYSSENEIIWASDEYPPPPITMPPHDMTIIIMFKER